MKAYEKGFSQVKSHKQHNTHVAINLKFTFLAKQPVGQTFVVYPMFLLSRGHGSMGAGRGSGVADGRLGWPAAT